MNPRGRLYLDSNLRITFFSVYQTPDPWGKLYPLEDAALDTDGRALVGGEGKEILEMKSKMKLTFLNSRSNKCSGTQAEK